MGNQNKTTGTLTAALYFLLYFLLYTVWYQVFSDVELVVKELNSKTEGWIFFREKFAL